MNKEFIIKILQAKQLQYEALKGVMPENILNRIENIENELLAIGKEYFMKVIINPSNNKVIKETKRNFSYLHLYNYNVDAIIVNKVYPKEALEGYFHKWIKNQEDAIEDIKESFTGIPIFYMELLKHELRTISRLKEVSDKLYGNTDPSKILFSSTIFSSMMEDDKDVFRIVLPFFNLDNMELLQKGEELTLIIKNERRKFILPDKLKNKEIQTAKYEDGMLKLLF